MTKKESILLILSLVLIFAGAGIFFFKKDSGSSSKDLLQIDLKTFKQAGGWGYDVRVGTTFFIHQDHIPAIPGYKMFVSEDEALKTGRFLVQKIKQTGKSVVTQDELNALGIHY